MLKQAFRYYHTLKYLQWTQVKYRLLYQFKKKTALPVWSPTNSTIHFSKKELYFLASIASPTSWLGNGRFRFLNIAHTFEKEIDWNFGAQGKLWTYNLNYFEFLSQSNISKIEGLGLIHDFIGKETTIKDGMEPFPISLRVIFWIKFIIKFQIADTQIDQSLFRQLRRLSAMPEYHLLGNHLLENGFSLMFGGIYFNDKKLIHQAHEILTAQLQEQVLPDGAHFELSPMYHQIMLFRILDVINLLSNNPQYSPKALLPFLQKIAALMLGWMTEITFANGDMPLVNDSANGIAPMADELLQYADTLQVAPQKVKLKESGYRKFKNENYEMMVDVGNIGPDYIPGHAHSDTFNFILYQNEKPLLVDTGISTYEKNKRRTLERSTSSHNTVMIGEAEQSEVWGGFRVARRAKVVELEASENRIRAVHDGYRRIGVAHERTFEFGKNEITIFDHIASNKTGTAFLHFYPNIDFELKEEKIIGKYWTISFENSKNIKIKDYLFAEAFNNTQEGKKVAITFMDHLKTTIILT